MESIISLILSLFFLRQFFFVSVFVFVLVLVLVFRRPPQRGVAINEDSDQEDDNRTLAARSPSGIN